jgi:PadR family transcriptional regulator PadR
MNRPLSGLLSERRTGLVSERRIQIHGYGIGVRLEQISRGVFRVNAGSLFPALRRLERNGLIKGEWRVTENNRRAKYYALTADGRAKLKRETRDWELQTTAIARILEASLGEL